MYSLVRLLDGGWARLRGGMGGSLEDVDALKEMLRTLYHAPLQDLNCSKSIRIVAQSFRRLRSDSQVSIY
jgi:hypothetical protein